MKTIKRVAETIYYFAEVGKLYVMDRETADKTMEFLRKHPKKKFRCKHHSDFSNVWRAK